MSSHSQPSTNEVKRVPMACTRCRAKKLKCRVADGAPGCQRCIDARADCTFVPVNLDQTPLTTSSIQGEYYTQQFRLERPMGHPGAQPYAAQPTASTHHSWNANDRGTRIEPPQQFQRIHAPTPTESSYTGTTHMSTGQYAGHFMPQQTQQGHQILSGYPPSHDMYPGSQWPSNSGINYPNQGIVPSQFNINDPQNVVIPASNYNQSNPNTAPWTNSAATNYYTRLPEDSYNSYSSSQDQYNSGSHE